VNPSKVLDPTSTNVLMHSLDTDESIIEMENDYSRTSVAPRRRRDESIIEMENDYSHDKR